MSYIGNRLKKHLISCGMTQGRLSRLIDVDQPNVNGCLNGRRRFTDSLLELISQVDELNLSLNQLRAWRLVDEQSPDVIRLAFEELAKGE
jgi:transcriptional regulator with XRE-family HTH domain